MAQATAAQGTPVKVSAEISKDALKAQRRYHTLAARGKVIKAEQDALRAIMEADMKDKGADILTHNGVAVVEQVQTTGAQVIDIASILKYFPAAAKYVTRKAAGTRFDAKKRA